MLTSQEPISWIPSLLSGFFFLRFTYLRFSPGITLYGDVVMTPPSSKGRCRGGMGKVRQSPLLLAGLGGAQPAQKHVSVVCDIFVAICLLPNCNVLNFSSWKMLKFVILI